MERERYSWLSAKALHLHFGTECGKAHIRSTYLFIGHLVADFDYIGGHTILKNFDSLWSLYMGCGCKQVVALRVEQILQGHYERGVLLGRERSVLKPGHKSSEMSIITLPSTGPGIYTFRVVLTDMLPSIKSRVQAMW